MYDVNSLGFILADSIEKTQMIEEVEKETGKTSKNGEKARIELETIFKIVHAMKIDYIPAYNDERKIVSFKFNDMEFYID